MTVQGHSHRWAWVTIGPPTWEPGPANQKESPQKGFITDRNIPQPPERGSPLPVVLAVMILQNVSIDRSQIASV
jgi:hypothetical protein